MNIQPQMIGVAQMVKDAGFAGRVFWLGHNSRPTTLLATFTVVIDGTKEEAQQLTDKLYDFMIEKKFTVRYKRVRSVTSRRAGFWRATVGYTKEVLL